MLKEKVREKPKQKCIPLTLTYNHFCSNISKQEVTKLRKKPKKKQI